MFLRSLILGGWILGMGLLTAARADIYADVTLSGGVTGTFRITLERNKAPVAVANFIGLATGQNGWIDPATGRLRNDPYYNGLTFHRVIAGFMSQTGSRSGDGTDGPGYTFANEIDSSLTHATSYTVAMANSGGAFSNGAQFYITTPASAAFLDGNYTIFGRVTSGTGVCDALNSVATNASDKPLVPVTISSITFGGSSLSSFNLKPPGLPRVSGGKPVLKINGASYALGYDHQPYSTYFATSSADLGVWSRFIHGEYFHATAPVAGDLDVTTLASGARRFFQIPRVDYSQARNTRMPSSIASKTFTYPGLIGFQSIKLFFNASGNGGTYTILDSSGASGSGNIIGMLYSVGDPANCQLPPYAPFLQVTLDTTAYFGGNFEIQNYRLEYTANGSGKHYTQTNVTNYENVSGNFTSTP